MAIRVVGWCATTFRVAMFKDCASCERTALSPLRGSDHLSPPTHGLRRELYSCAASRLGLGCFRLRVPVGYSSSHTFSLAESSSHAIPITKTMKILEFCLPSFTFRAKLLY